MSHRAALVIAVGAALTGGGAEPIRSDVLTRSTPVVIVEECRCCRNSSMEFEHIFNTTTCTGEENDAVEAVQGSPVLMALASGEESCESGFTCHKASSGGGSGGGPGCGSDCDFHDGEDWRQGLCSHHPDCTLTEELELLDAVDAEDFALVVRHVKANPTRVLLNSERGLLQIRNCRGQIYSQVSVDVVALSEFL